MKMISESTESSDASLTGGKGFHLQKLVKWGAPVPPFFVITTEAFRYFRSNSKIPADIEKRFSDFFKLHTKIALRSSMTAEDNVDSSFAGLFETLLDVHQGNWKESLLHIYHSVHSSRVREYIEKKSLDVDLQMAVVAQALVEVEKSGVLFTRSPVEPTSAVAIDAGFGMGEGVVSGLADVDNYQLTRTGELISVQLNNNVQVLNEREMADLVQLSLRLEKRSGFPSDIEWGYKDDQLFIFQIRPITRSFEPLTYFVDTNLSESYPGVVSPFTGAFVQKAYENVFSESAIIMGANQKRLEILRHHYARLISSVDDHLYYNLEHYYAVLRALPGGEKNIENWHKMIGGRIEEGVVPYHATELSTFETLRTLWAMIRLASGKNDIYSALLMSLENIRTEIENEIRILKDPVETIRYLNELINRPLGFGLTVVNDIFIMMGLGYLTKVLKGKGYKEESVIDLLKTTEGVDSVKPLEHFNELVKKLSDNFIFQFSEAELTPSFDPYSELFAKLRLQGFVAEVKALEDFLRLYGDRSFEELKLESLPLKNNPLLLKELITWARKNPSIHQSHGKTTDVIPMGFIESKILNFTREAISMREATRLWRGKFYHLLRQLVLSLGEQLKEGHSSWNDYTVLDFFSLTPMEWQRFAGGDMSREAAQTLIKKRRPWQTKKKHFPEIISWVKGEPLPEIGKVSSSSLIEGQGVSPGSAEGIALVLDNPQDALTSEYQEFILVTKNTDPAWVYIMSRSLGLISEKGSLLSHTAIIGRELNIPTIVGVKNATQKIKSGDRIRINASKGVIEIL